MLWDIAKMLGERTFVTLRSKDAFREHFFILQRTFQWLAE